MIQYLYNDEIDRTRWDACLDNLPVCKPYPYSWYLDIMAPGWEALVDDDYDSVFPVPAFRKYGCYYIATPVFLQQLGIFSPDNNEDVKIAEYLAFMPEFYRLVDLCIAQDPSGSDFRIVARDNYELDLSVHYSRLWEGFTSDCKRNIRHAMAETCNTPSDVVPGEIISLFRTHSGRGLKGVRTRNYHRLEKLIEYCTANGKGRLIGVRNASDSLIYGLFAVINHGTITLLFTATSPESRERKTGYLVINSIIEEFAGRDMILDFAGSSIPGVAAYNRSYGARCVPYYQIYRNRLPWPVRMFK